ncbi:MAG: hypothetical protein U9P81_02565 [Euryarchaeota archaeon]|nr:hypothetical protein [Euryarchaeota archaeon]
MFSTSQVIARFIGKISFDLLDSVWNFIGIIRIANANKIIINIIPTTSSQSILLNAG